MASIAERHKYILEKLNKEGFIRIQDIANELDVTTVTVRKDLKYLESKNLLLITHGSASPSNPLISEVKAKEKEKRHGEEKRRIGEAALALLEPSDSIIIASGSSTYAFAQQLTPGSCQRVITSSLSIASLLNQIESMEVFQLGGPLRKNSNSVIGHFAESFFNNITCSKFFIGVDGISLDHGITNSNIDETRLNRIMMDASLETIVLADSSKFERRGLGRICNLNQVNTIITDHGISSSTAAMIREMGVKLIIT